MFKEWQLMAGEGCLLREVPLSPTFPRTLTPLHSITTIKQLEPRTMEQFQPNFTFCGHNFQFILVSVSSLGKILTPLTSSLNKDFEIIMILAEDPIQKSPHIKILCVSEPQ